MSRPATTILAPLTCLILLAGPAVAQRTTAAVTEADLRTRLLILADDSMQGRESGRLGNVRATDYIAAELQRLGLERAGDNGTWFQTIPLVTRGIDPASTLRADTTRLVLTRDFLPMRSIGGNTLGGSFRADNVPVVFGGRIDDPAMISPDAARGKFVIFLPSLSATFAGNGGTLNRYLGASAIGIVVLEQIVPSSLAAYQSPRVLLVDSTQPQPPAIPTVLLTAAATWRLLGSAPEGLTPGTAGRTASGAFGMTDAPMPYPARNVIGIVRGTDRARRNAFVAIGAHSDHVGMSAVPLDHDSVRAFNEVLRPMGANDRPRRPTPADIDRIRAIRDSLARDHAPRLDSIFNGADDDASGVSVSLELAEYFRGHPPKRSLLFVFHTAEERGIYGSQFFTDHTTVPRDSIVAQINMDQVSRGGPADVAGSPANTLYLLGTRRLSTELGDLVESVNARGAHWNFNYDYDANGHPANGYCRSDHWMYARYGIPVAFFSAGWHRDYHMVTDEVQYANTGTMLKVATLVRDVTQAVADLNHAPVVDHPKPDPRAPCRQ